MVSRLRVRFSVVASKRYVRLRGSKKLFNALSLSPCTFGFSFLATLFLGLAVQAQQEVSPDNAQAAPASWTSYEEMHEDNVEEFIKNPGLGISRLVRAIENAARDEERSVANAMSRRVTIGKRVYAVKSIELVGTSMHSPPVVFSNPIVHSVHGQPKTLLAQSQAVPQPPNTETNSPRNTYRSLTDYEVDVIASFNKGGEISVQIKDSDRIVLAPIRAREDCLSCHEGSKNGDVLGAFRYHLAPAR